MTYHVSKAAKADLKHIYFEGAALFGEAQATAYVRDLESLFTMLAQFPHMARLRTEISPPAYGHPHESHIVFYDLLDNGDIEIVRIRHAREDWMSDSGEEG